MIIICKKITFYFLRFFLFRKYFSKKRIGISFFTTFCQLLFFSIFVTSKVGTSQHLLKNFFD